LKPHLRPVGGARAAPARIAIEGVSKAFRRTRGAVPVEALRGVSLAVADRSFTTIVGPSGCGKTTLLRLVNGLIAPDSGSVLVSGARPKPGPDIGFVFQTFRLIPWRTARDNVAFPLEVAGRGVEERSRAADEWLARVGPAGFEDAYPSELSGGMRQRVALARALVGRPAILLMDEPFASIDAQTREFMQAELLRIWTEERNTVLFVTHSVDEAILLADRVVLMRPRPGRVEEVIDVDLARPRDPDAVRGHPRFVELRRHLWGRLREMVTAPVPAA